MGLHLGRSTAPSSQQRSWQLAPPPLSPGAHDLHVRCSSPWRCPRGKLESQLPTCHSCISRPDVVRPTTRRRLGCKGDSKKPVGWENRRDGNPQPSRRLPAGAAGRRYRRRAESADTASTAVAFAATVAKEDEGEGRAHRLQTRRETEGRGRG